MKEFTIKKKDKLVNVKVNNFYLSKDSINRMKRPKNKTKQKKPNNSL